MKMKELTASMSINSTKTAQAGSYGSQWTKEQLNVLLMPLKPGKK
jgi:hypothetical protein